MRYCFVKKTYCFLSEIIYLCQVFHDNENHCKTMRKFRGINCEYAILLELKSVDYQISTCCVRFPAGLLGENEK